MAIKKAKIYMPGESFDFEVEKYGVKKIEVTKGESGIRIHKKDGSIKSFFNVPYSIEESNESNYLSVREVRYGDSFID